ncbi:acyl-CoA dehydrogenase family protein [Streptomyces sp. NPDC007325]|uniref:acyl-CoA dehydrogenase family protein n=1 Tax=Streptomyces sp. NPDC007325 TaxID=3154588 RepID=UPI003411B52F
MSHESHEPNLLYTDTEDALRDAVRSLLTDRAGHQDVLDRIETGDPYPAGLWPALAAGIGAAGLLVPEKLGGQGASHREAAVVLEELGRAVTPAPYLTAAVIATETLLALTATDGPATAHIATDGPATAHPVTEGPAAALLAELAAGERTAVLAVPLTTAPRTGFTATGPVRAVADAVAADVFLVPRPTGLYAVPAAEATVTPTTPLDLTRPLATVDASGAAGTLLAGPEAARTAVRRGLLAGAGLLASEQLGLAEWCLEETVRHTKERFQFNRPVGSFQALKHRMAHLWLDLVGARAAARAAADALAAGAADAELTVAVAQAYCSGVAVRAAEECVQLHGGIGMTWEHPAHLALKRAKADQLALGSTGHHQDVLADLMDLPAPA